MSSGTRGEKQLVVEIIVSTLSAPNYYILFLTAILSVCRLSPTWISSIQIGNKFAVYIAFKHVFWSILDQITYFFYGFIEDNVKRLNEIAIPVARGRINTSETNS